MDGRRNTSRPTDSRWRSWLPAGVLATLSLILLAVALAPSFWSAGSTGFSLPPTTVDPANQGSIGREQLAGIPGWGQRSVGEDESNSSASRSSTGTTTERIAGQVSGAGAAGSTTSTREQPQLANPERVVIPAIEVDSELIPVGVKENREMEVPPFGLAGWYKHGPKPGASGPSVVVAHVDSRKGPDVFYRLKELEAGDEVKIVYSDGQTVTFSVHAREMLPKTQLPVDRIWNDTQDPALRLITCGGEFNRQTRHYVSNVIVWASFLQAG